MSAVRLTSGAFPVPNTPAAAGASLQLFFSSFQDAAADVAWAVHRVEDGGRRVRVGGGTVRVAGRGVETVALRPGEVEGRVVEVNVELPSRAVVPTAAVVVHFLTDASRELALWIAPAEFAVSQTDRRAGGRMERVRTL